MLKNAITFVCGKLMQEKLFIITSATFLAVLACLGDQIFGYGFLTIFAVKFYLSMSVAVQLDARIPQQATVTN